MRYTDALPDIVAGVEASAIAPLVVVKKTELGTVEGLAGEITKVKDDGVRVVRFFRPTSPLV